MAIQPLPREEWRGSSRALPSCNTADSSHDKSCDNNVVPTGRVVAIIDRTNRDIVASFPVRERKLIYMYMYCTCTCNVQLTSCSFVVHVHVRRRGFLVLERQRESLLFRMIVDYLKLGLVPAWLVN